ncbi:MAG: PHP domain-containing protein [Candidatus Binatia bacterium]
MTDDLRPGVVQALREIGILLRLTGDARFRARAYERAADALERVPRPLDALIERGELTAIPGIGARLAGIIEEIARTGSARLLEQLRAQFPAGTVELIDIPYLGLKKIAALEAALGISSRAELRAACAAGCVRAVPGFSARAEEKILAALDAPRARDESVRSETALAAAEPLLDYLRDCPPVARLDMAGSLRRGRETVRRVHVVAATGSPAAVLDRFERYPGSVGTAARSEADAAVQLVDGPAAVLHAVARAEYAAALVCFTGSRAHVEKLSERARAQELRLDRTGLWTSAGRRVPIRSEEALYRRLGLQPIPPELREGAGEIEAAERGALPDLIGAADVRGAVHVHTTYSDGKNSIEEMARAAEAMGMQYLTITDHSPSAAYAGGVTLDRLRRQWEEIARVQERVSIRLLRGTESDILRNGALDYPDDILEQFDVIIASIHARHRLSASEMTERVLTAMRYPVFKIWGHPLGRLLTKRPPIDCDVERILDAIAVSQAAIEINGDPYRLDLEPRWVRAARARRIPFVLSTDAHSVGALANVRFAVSVARRGWVAKDEVLNALPPEEFAARVHPMGPAF